jgi:hypothetical protein
MVSDGRFRVKFRFLESENMAISTELTVKAREAIFEEMAPVTRDVALEGLKRLQAGYQISLLVQYDLGTLVNSIYSDETLNDAQKKKEIQRLADYWNQPNINTSTLYDLRNVSTAFERDFVKAQVEERMANGGYLTWSHFKELQKIGSEKRQMAVLKQIRQHCWSAKELALELQGKKESEIKRAGGRKPSLPKTPNAMLQKIFASVQQTDNYLEAVAEPLEGMFMEMAPTEFDEQFVENLDNTLSRLDQMEQHIKETRSKLKNVRKRAASIATSTEPAMALAAKKAVSEDTPEAAEARGEEAAEAIVSAKLAVRKIPKRARK